jgi:hypothetical protein
VSRSGDDGLEDTRYLARLSVPRAGGWRAWGTVRGEFGRQLAEQESAAVALHMDSEIRRGRDYVRVVIVATVDAANVAEALDLLGLRLDGELRATPACPSRGIRGCCRG